jgi:hypothetical protein
LSQKQPKKGCGQSSSSRSFAKHVQGPEFNPQYHKKLYKINHKQAKYLSKDTMIKMKSSAVYYLNLGSTCLPEYCPFIGALAYLFVFGGAGS